MSKIFESKVEVSRYFWQIFLSSKNVTFALFKTSQRIQFKRKFTCTKQLATGL